MSDKNKRSIEWYYLNRDRVLKKSKSKPKVTCHYCSRTIYADRLDAHNKTVLHCDRVNRYKTLYSL